VTGDNQFSVRQDDYSLQVTKPGDRFFFIRVDTAQTSASQMVFSDFLLGGQCDSVAISALGLICDAMDMPRAGMKVIMRDVCPGASPFDHANDKVVRAHDSIADIFRQFFKRRDIHVENVYLEINRGKFDTILFLK
jgi:hypothetical protein